LDISRFIYKQNGHSEDVISRTGRVAVGDAIVRDSVVLLKISYVIGFILDALVAIQMFFPSILATTAGLGTFYPGPDFLYASYMSGVMMLGWCAILLWCYRKPVERMGVLLITDIPVIIGLMVNDVLSYMMGFLPLTALIIYLAIQAGLILLFAISYAINRNQ
jgi:hypothetical protein